MLQSSRHAIRRSSPSAICILTTALMLGLAISCKERDRSRQTPAPTPAAPEHSPQPHAAPAAAEARAEHSAETAARVWSFDDVPRGALPDGWSSSVGQWRVEATAEPSGGQVLVQTAQNASPVFNVALLSSESHTDIDIRVRLRARDGRIDQGGGVVWRAKDAQNYYIARYNPLEDNYRVYTVKGGRRSQLASADVTVSHDGWHTLRVTMSGNRIQCFLDGAKYLDVRDDTFTTAGQVGLWTKADARTEFDDLRVLAPVAALDVGAISAAVGVEASAGPDGVVRAAWPRTDVPVRIDGMPFPPPAGLTSWAAFMPTREGAMMMGDTVVFQDEVSPAMDAAFAQGLEITALHNHFLYDEPKVYFMHIGGPEGNPKRVTGVDRFRRGRVGPYPAVQLMSEAWAGGP